MKSQKLFNALAASALFVFFSGTAQAAATYCAPNTSNAAGLTTSDMTYNSGSTTATDCYGVVNGNDSQGAINGLGLTWGSDWTFLTKDEGSGTGSYMGLAFTLSATDGTSGGWTLTAVDTNGSLPMNLPTSLDFIGVLKGGPAYALYFFDDVIFNGSNAGSWTMNFVNRGGNIPNLSHLSLYIRGGDGEIPQEVPEPSVLALLGLGIFGLAAFRRRKFQK